MRLRFLALVVVIVARPLFAEPPLTGTKACNRAAELIHEGKPAEAISLLESARTTMPVGEMWAWWGNLAMAREELRDHKGALDAYEESAKLKPDSWFRVARAGLLFQFRQFEEAKQLLADPDPDDAEVASRLQAALEGPFHDRWPKAAPSLEFVGPAGWVRVVSDVGIDPEELDDWEKGPDTQDPRGKSKQLVMIANLLERLRSDLVNRLKLPAARWPKGKVATVFFVLDPERFKALAHTIGGGAPRENQFGFYEPNVKVVVTSGEPAKPPDSIDPDTLDTLFHEFTHQVLDVFLRERPIWLNEGLAEVAGKAVPSANGPLTWGGKGVAGGKRMTRAERITEMFKEKRFTPLAEFVRLDAAGWAKGDPLDRYAQAWSIVDCALNGKDERLRAVILRLIAELAAGKPAAEVIDEVLPAGTCDEWERRWLEEASR